MSSSSPVVIKPNGHFCVKTVALSDAANTSPLGGTLLNPVITGITTGRKIFVNIAYSKQVPAPPHGSEDAIQRAMQGEDIDELNPDGWYVPVVVSPSRQDKDKVGNVCFVFDAIFNSGLKERVLTDPDFKMFVIELALQRIEAQNYIALSRQVGTPNLVSKGKLEPRTVVLPSPAAPASGPKRALIEDLTPPQSQNRPGILKAPNTDSQPPVVNPPAPLTAELTPTWTWVKQEDKIVITIHVPKLEHAHIAHSTFDIEPRRIILAIPPMYSLDVDLNLSDAELVVRSAGSDNALTLKRLRDLDVDGATAEWRVADGFMVITA